MSKQTLIPREAFVTLVDNRWPFLGIYLRLNPQIIPDEMLVFETLSYEKFSAYIFDLFNTLDENLVDIKKLIKFLEVNKEPCIPDKYKGIDTSNTSVDGFLFVNKPLDLEKDNIDQWVEKVLTTEPLISIRPLLKLAYVKSNRKEINAALDKRKDLLKPLSELADWLDKLESKVRKEEVPVKRKWFNI